MSDTSIATTSGDNSPLKICRLTSVDEGLGGDDGFLDVMDAEVAALTSGSPAHVSSAMTSLFKAPINKAATSLDQDDDTPVVSFQDCCYVHYHFCCY